MTTTKGSLMEAKLRHGRSLGTGMHTSDLTHRRLIVAPNAVRQEQRKEQGQVVGVKGRLDDHMREILVECMRAGLHPSAAAQGAGIARDTLSRWLSTGRRDAELELSTPYAKLYIEMAAAQSHAETQALVNLMEAASEPKHWAANAWFLERRYPERWGKKTRTEHTGADGGPIKQQVAVLMVSPEKLNEALALTRGKGHQTIDVTPDEQDEPDADSVLEAGDG